MSKLLYKDHTYSLSQLIDLRGQSPFYKDGDVIDQSDGTVCDIEQIDGLRDKYINELIPFTERVKMLEKSEKGKNIKVLERKYSEKRISKDELLYLVKCKNSKHFEVNYSDFFIVNAGKDKPKDLKMLDYGRFVALMDLMTFKNKVAKRENGKVVSEGMIMEYLQISSPKSLYAFINRLSKFGMLAKTGYGKKKFIHINPAYAKRKMKVTQTIYDLFKDDLKGYLSEYEIAYFEMCEEDTTESTLEITESEDSIEIGF